MLAISLPLKHVGTFFEFNMHAESPTVYCLQVHLPDQQLIYYNDEDIADEVFVRATPKPASSMAHSTVTRALGILWNSYVSSSRMFYMRYK